MFGRLNILFYDLGHNVLSHTSLMIPSPAYKGSSRYLSRSTVLQIRRFNTFITCSGFNPETSTTSTGIAYIPSLRSTQQGVPSVFRNVCCHYTGLYMLFRVTDLQTDKTGVVIPCKTSPGARSMTRSSSFSHSCHCEVDCPDGFGLCWVIEGRGSLLYWSIGFIRCGSAL